MTLWFCHQNQSGYDKGKLRRINLDESPCPGVQALGVNGDNTSHYWLEEDGRDELKTENKPPYRVPLMSEIAALPLNSYSVVSTFAGGGGSSTGYRMAGYNVLWANEFLPKAQKTYSVNHPSTILDTRSIHNITAKDILKATGLKEGELDIFDGSPPCQSFSTAGQRERGWEKLRDYGDGIKQRNDDLFFEYARLLKGLQPKVFIAENVSGLVKGTAKGYFKTILATLKRCGYTVEAKLLDAQWLGVPQMRQRIIFMGVREDLKLSPVYPSPLPYRYSVRDAISARVIHDTSGLFSQGDVTERPCPAITIGSNSMNSHHYQVEAIEGANGYNAHAFSSTDEPAATVQAGRSLSVIEEGPDLAGYAIGAEWDKLKPGEESPKYRNLKRLSFEVPSMTVTAIGGESAGIASVTHPSERRKLSIPELKRICGFPDDYILEGSYADQWFVCGNAVPPVMMAAIATSIRDGILNKLPA